MTSHRSPRQPSSGNKRGISDDAGREFLMRILVVGSGGREHALVWKLAQSPRCEAIYCAPGNPGIAESATLVPIEASDHSGMAAWASEHSIDLVVIGPDDPLANGIVDVMHEAGLRIFGPTRQAAQIEWSKAWAKQFCFENDIPTANSASFRDAASAHTYIDDTPDALVVKADGLALGKGVFVCGDHAEAHSAVDRLLVYGDLGPAGTEVVIEEKMRGPEVSVSIVADGSTYRMLPFARDHKAVYDGNKGPNTGGMGAYSPLLDLTPEIRREIEFKIVGPAMRGLRHGNRPFVGFLFPGLMLTDRGVKVIEFNSRLGDPEAQTILPLLDFDLAALLFDAASGDLSSHPVELPMRAGASCCVIAASGGYPGSYSTGLPIRGLRDAVENTLVFQAGTRISNEAAVTGGGRVLSVVGLGDSIADARQRAYTRLDKIHFDGIQFRRDIAMP